MKEIVIDTDKARFEPPFGAATVNCPPAPISAKGWRPTISGKPMCLESDIASVKSTGTYVVGAFVAPGNGDATIKALKPDHKPAWCKVMGVGVLLMGSQFTAQFIGSAPAKKPAPPPPPATDDPVYKVPISGLGSFITQQKFVTVG